jgi:hypothetical protein
MSCEISRGILGVVQRGFVDPNGHPGDADDLPFSAADGITAFFNELGQRGVGAGKPNLRDPDAWTCLVELALLVAGELALQSAPPGVRAAMEFAGLAARAVKELS